MNLSKQQLLQIIREETASMTEEDEEEADVVTDYTDPETPDPDEEHTGMPSGPNKANKQQAGSTPPMRWGPPGGWRMRDKHEPGAKERKYRESLTHSRLQQIIREETLNELEEGRFSDAFSRAKETIGSVGKAALEKGKEAVGIPTHTGGRVTRGGSRGKRGKAGSVLGVDASETAAEAEAALAAETPYGPQHSIHTATRDARGSGRVTAGGSGGERAKAGKLLGVDPSQDPVDVDPAKFPGGPGESHPFTYFDRPGEPRPMTDRPPRPDPSAARFSPEDICGDLPTKGDTAQCMQKMFPQKESLTRLRLRQMVMEELQVNEEEKWIQGAEEDIEKRGTEGVCTGKKFGGPTCRAGTKRYNLAKTFRKMAKKRKKKKKE